MRKGINLHMVFLEKRGNVNSNLRTCTGCYLAGYLVEGDGLERLLIASCLDVAVVFIIVIRAFYGLYDGAGTIKNGEGAASNVGLESMREGAFVRALKSLFQVSDYHTKPGLTYIEVTVIPVGSGEALNSGPWLTWKNADHAARR